MPDMSSLSDSLQVWLALATSGLVLLGFSSLAASLASAPGNGLRPHQIFGIRAITTNSLYLSFLSFLPLVILQFEGQGAQACTALRLEAYLPCSELGGLAERKVWAVTSFAALVALAWQYAVQIWRILLTRDGHDSIRIAVFFLVPAPLVAYAQLVNLEANLMPLSLLGAAFFAWTACGHFYLFLHRLGSQG